MKLITWNVNGFRARLDDIVKIILTEQPDVFFMQESKIDIETYNSSFNDKLKELGYLSYLSPYNPSKFHGVLTLLKGNIFSETNVISLGRVHNFVYNNISYYNCYINQGQEIDSKEYNSKLELMSLLTDVLTNDKNNIISGGDYNILPTNDDLWSTYYWHEGIVSCTPREREAFRILLEKSKLQNLVLDEEVKFTWYGYLTQRFKYKGDDLLEQNGKYGIKCDHILTNIKINKSKLLLEYRLPKKRPTKPTSDHVPIMIIY